MPLFPENRKLPNLVHGHGLDMDRTCFILKLFYPVTLILSQTTAKEPLSIKNKRPLNCASVTLLSVET